ncbi:hemin-degrading factor [Pseudomonas kuykendallii]|uniref:Hemin-degrading factor n=1 Tax=Pseudomonas kuykendallii TaxID=1007099 RepID=A0A2W5CU29_9PSED|nr:ChuX/HutX family heme-like substrate-binding protein [Pseudomonas kuykendallii]PZP21508.1 MAG: hemin-degrading factor [Pseudomonas kuykendallii]
MSLSPPGASSASRLYQAWQSLREQQPHLRARDAAAALGVSEAELIASRIGLDAVRLRPEWAALLPALGDLGQVMALTRNEQCVHERKGPYREVSIAPNGQMGLVVSPDIDLRFFLSGWAFAFAIVEQTDHGAHRSLQFFDRQGAAVHKVFLTEASEVPAWEPLIERFRAESQSAELELQAAAEPDATVADASVDVEALRADWADLKDTHHFHAMLRKHAVARTQALRLAGAEWAEPLQPAELPRTLDVAGVREVPVMVFVGNRHCIQIHTGPVRNLRWMGEWFNVLDPLFNLHLKTSGVHELWRVRKLSVDGVVTSLEAFDADGELVLQLFGERKPGTPERQDWRTLAEQASVLEA